MTNSKPLVRKHCAPHTAAASTHGCPVVKAAFDSAIGIDVHHSILVCAYQACDTQAGEIRTEVAEFGTTVSALKELIEWVKQRQPQRILMESTGVLWLSPYEALERAGFTSSDLALINARDFKAVAGRKTDTQDAIRLAEYARLGNIRTSFVPAREFREQRQIARQITKHTNELQRCKSRLIKTLNFVGCRPTAAFSNVNGKAAQKILMEYIRGANIREAAEKHGARLRHTPQEIEDILCFELYENMQDLLRIQLEEIDRLKETIESLWVLLRRAQQRHEPLLERLIKIPGIREVAARLILAEVTDDVSSFPNAERFASWAGLCPGNNESAGKRSSAAAAKGNKWRRRVLVECAQAVALSCSSPLRSRFLALKMRRGYRRAVVAIAHFLLRIIYALIKTGKCYVSRASNTLRKLRIERYSRCVNDIRRENFEIHANGLLVDKDTGAPEVLEAEFNPA